MYLLHWTCLTYLNKKLYCKSEKNLRKNYKTSLSIASRRQPRSPDSHVQGVVGIVNSSLLLLPYSLNGLDSWRLV